MRSKWLWAALALVAVLGIATAASARTRDLITSHQTRPSGVIAFVRGHDKASEIWRSNADGSGLKRLTSNTRGYEEQPEWSPDGRSIAFDRTVDGGKTLRVYVMDANGHGLRVVSPKGGTFAQVPKWSPDGRWIAFAGSGGIFGECSLDAFVVHPNGTGFHRILGGKPNLGTPVWSPDGKRMAISREYPNQRPSYWIFVGRADGTHLRRLTAGLDPSWSPDGRRIAFSRRTGGTLRIFLIGADGRGLRPLSRQSMEFDPAWSPDGKWIAYWSVRGGGQEIRARPVAGGPAVHLTHAPANSGDSGPAWHPEGT